MNRVIFTPYFLGAHVPGFEPLAAPAWERNTPLLPSGDTQKRMVTLFRLLAEKVATVVRVGERPISFAGDCCSAIAVLAGLQRAGVHPTLLWLDAHGDFNTWETSPSGFLGGMPLAMLTGRGEQTIVEGLGLQTIDDSKVVLSDARDLDPKEKKALKASRVKHVPRFEDMLQNSLPGGPLYLHVDVDVIDAREAPGMEYPVPGGPSAQLVEAFLKRVDSTGRLAALSVSAWNPERDEDGTTQRRVMNVLQPFCDLSN